MQSPEQRHVSTRLSTTPWLSCSTAVDITRFLISFLPSGKDRTLCVVRVKLMAMTTIFLFIFIFIIYVVPIEINAQHPMGFILCGADKDNRP